MGVMLCCETLFRHRWLRSEFVTWFGLRTSQGYVSHFVRLTDPPFLFAYFFRTILLVLVVVLVFAGVCIWDLKIGWTLAVARLLLSVGSLSTASSSLRGVLTATSWSACLLFSSSFFSWAALFFLLFFWEDVMTSSVCNLAGVLFSSEISGISLFSSRVMS